MDKQSSHFDTINAAKSRKEIQNTWVRNIVCPENFLKDTKNPFNVTIRSVRLEDNKMRIEKLPTRQAQGFFLFAVNSLSLPLFLLPTLSLPPILFLSLPLPTPFLYIPPFFIFFLFFLSPFTLIYRRSNRRSKLFRCASVNSPARVCAYAHQ